MKRKSKKYIRFVIICSLLTIIFTFCVNSINLSGQAVSKYTGTGTGGSTWWSGLPNGYTYPNLSGMFPTGQINSDGMALTNFSFLTSYVFDTFGAIFPYYFISTFVHSGDSLVMAFMTDDARVTSVTQVVGSQWQVNVQASTILYFTFVSVSGQPSYISGPVVDTSMTYTAEIYSNLDSSFYHNLIDSNNRPFNSTNYPASTYGQVIGGSTLNRYNYAGFSWYRALYDFYNSGYDMSPNDKTFIQNIVNTINTTLNTALQAIEDSIKSGNDTLQDLQEYNQTLISIMTSQLHILTSTFEVTHLINNSVRESAADIVFNQHWELMSKDNPYSYISVMNRAYGKAVPDGFINSKNGGYKIYNPATGQYIPIDSETGEYILEVDSYGNKIIPVDSLGNSLIPLDDNGNPMNSFDVGSIDIINNTLESINIMENEISSELKSSLDDLKLYVDITFDSLDVHFESFAFVRDLIMRVWDSLGAFQVIFILSILILIFLGFFTQGGIYFHAR